MAKFNKFEDIKVWQRSKNFSIEIYKEFRECKDFSFRNQIERASISISNNIAEGFERRGDKEFRKFLFIAKGSCGEVRSMIYIALELEYINKEKFEYFYQESVEISKMLSGLIKTLD